MKLKTIFLSAISIMAVFLNSCASKEASNQNLVLKGTFSDEIVTLDPYFLARQKKAESNFFGLSPNNQSSSLTDNSNTNEAEDDESEAADTQHSLTINKNDAKSSLFGGIEVIWPTNGTLTSLFGMRKLGRRTKMHTGIDIGAAKGTPIISAADGQVLFAGKKRGYGYAVIVAHDNDHETLYAHMSKMTVRTGQFITRDQLIGYVGKTGHVTGANLHFETRVHGVAYNPLSFLPPSHAGVLKVGMKTPTYTEQVSYYENASKMAYVTKR